MEVDDREGEAPAEPLRVMAHRLSGSAGASPSHRVEPLFLALTNH